MTDSPNKRKHSKSTKLVPIEGTNKIKDKLSLFKL